MNVAVGWKRGERGCAGLRMCTSQIVCIITIENYSSIKLNLVFTLFVNHYCEPVSVQCALRIIYASILFRYGMFAVPHTLQQLHAAEISRNPNYESSFMMPFWYIFMCTFACVFICFSLFFLCAFHFSS